MDKNKLVYKTSLLMNKSKGQHFLQNPEIIKSIVQKSAVNDKEIVLEIGPGNGNLTKLLLEKSKKVYAIEVDTRMISELIKRFPKYSNLGQKLTIINGDAIKTKWPYFDLLIANLPYQISSPVIFKLLCHRPLFKCAIIMVQREFGLRMVAQPGSDMYCRLSCSIKLFADCQHLMKVSKKNFTPPPKVESCIIRIEPKKEIPKVDFVQWDGILKIAFSRKNKTLGAIFSTKSLLKILYYNYNIIKANNNNNNYSDNMVFEDDINKNSKFKDIDSDKMNEFKSVVLEVLKSNKLNDKRPSKLFYYEFLELLQNFNEKGIFFN